MKIKYMLLLVAIVASLFSGCTEKSTENEEEGFGPNTSITYIAYTPHGQAWSSEMNISFEDFAINERSRYLKAKSVFSIIKNDTKGIDSDIAKLKIIEEHCNFIVPEYKEYCIIEAIKMNFEHPDYYGLPYYLSEPIHGNMINWSTGEFANNTMPDYLVVEK